MQAPLSFPHESKGEKKFLAWAVSLAVIAHVLFFMIPFVKPEVEPSPPKRVVHTPSIIKIDLKPPEVPTPLEPPVDRPKPTEKPAMPVPVPDADPITESPVDLDDWPEVELGPDVDVWLDEAAPPITPAPAIVDAGTTGVTSPVALSKPSPRYPPMAKQTRMSGTVWLQAIITETGDVEAVTVIRAPRPDLGFSEAAMEAVREWKYQPGTFQGKPAKVRMTVKVAFSLSP